MHQLAADLYAGDAGGDDEAAALSPPAAVSDLCHGPHGHPRAGLPLQYGPLFIVDFFFNCEIIIVCGESMLMDFVNLCPHKRLTKY